VSTFEKLTQAERLRLVIARSMLQVATDGHTYQMLESLAHSAG
jgi:hypothetical protein